LEVEFMGRKRKEKIGIFDRIGEAVNLEKCPDCPEHPDCFSCLDGKCTALNVSGGQGCVFYKMAERAIEEARAGYKQLREAGRIDLIQKYIKAYAAMGLLDVDIEKSAEKATELEAFRASDYRAALTEMGKESEAVPEVQPVSVSVSD